MRIATWNVNSIRSRLEQLTGWLARSGPDVLCMQETKVEDDRFPIEALEECGYKTVFTGEKTYNGVAIAARFGLGLEDVQKHMHGEDGSSQKRFIAATVEGVRVVCVYVPNGQSVGTEAWTFKLGWLSRLALELRDHHKPDGDLVVCGDFNVAPETIDCAEPKKWLDTVLFHPDVRAALKRVTDVGLVDALRLKHEGEEGLYSWWDYRMGMFKKNKGLRIDLSLVSKSLAARVVDCAVDKRPRALERPSDHAPVVLEIA